jgi:uncharacterized protein YndB with AHSA1/START domain
MEMWDEDYINMEKQAYIQVKPDGLGDFQFGLVVGQIDGEIEEISGNEKFVFTFDGTDELDPVSGSGWLKFSTSMSLKGRFKFHLGDSSGFKAKRVK